ncbi:MAG: hypothetical protein ACYTFA_15255, partial [Planctomycetota bacterium]
MRALIVNPVDHPLPEQSADLLGDLGWDIATAPDYDAAVDAIRSGSIAAILLPEPRDEHERGTQDGAFSNLMRIIDAQRIAAVV